MIRTIYPGQTCPQCGAQLTADIGVSEAAGGVMYCDSPRVECSESDAAKLALFNELTEACGKLLPILEALRYSVGLGKSQLERIEKAKSLLAKARELQ